MAGGLVVILKSGLYCQRNAGLAGVLGMLIGVVLILVNGVNICFKTRLS